jgi:hypothetical protein
MSAAQPQAMAAGGIVAFVGGGAVEAAEKRLSQAQRALQKYGGAQRNMDPEGYRSAQQKVEAAQAELIQEVEAARAELMRVTAPQAKAAARLGAAQGLGISRGLRQIQPPAAPLSFGADMAERRRQELPAAPAGAINPLSSLEAMAGTLGSGGSLSVGSLGGLESALGGAAGAGAGAAAAAPRPAAPPAGIAAPAAPPAAQSGAELATSDMVQKTRDVTTDALGQNPEKIRKDRAKEAEAVARYTPEELAEKRSRIAELQALQPSEQALRDRRLIAGLLGAQSGYGIGSTLGAFGRASVSEGERQEAAQRANVLERQKMLDQLLEAGVAARKKGFEAGTAAEKDVRAGRRAAAGDVTQLQVAQQRALDSRLDRESRERLAREANAIRQEANRIQAESTKGGRSERLEASRQRLIVSIAGLEEKLLAAAKATPITLDIMLIQNKIAKGEKLSAGEQNAYNSFKDSQKLATAGARDRANELREELGLPPRVAPAAPADDSKGFSLVNTSLSK